MRAATDNQILFYFENSCIISHNKIGILLNLTLNFILSNTYTFFCERHHGEGFWSWFWSCDLRLLKLSLRNLGEL